jgi:hypothetical protein
MAVPRMREIMARAFLGEGNVERQAIVQMLAEFGFQQDLAESDSDSEEEEEKDGGGGGVAGGGGGGGGRAHNMEEYQQYIHDPIEIKSWHCPPCGGTDYNFTVDNFRIEGEECDCTSNFAQDICILNKDSDYLAARGMDIEAMKLEADANCNDELVLDNHDRRKSLYNLGFNYFNYHNLEEHERKRLPKCFEALIRWLHPEFKGHYMGFKLS